MAEGFETEARSHRRDAARANQELANVFAPGKSAVGDDGDFDAKMQIMNRYFEIERYRMVRCYLKHGVEDLDKLFIVARLSDNPRPVQFDLREAREKYTWS